MRLVLRFLKETRLLVLWKEYVLKRNKKSSIKEHWSNFEYPEDVFAFSSFTTFIEGKKKLMLPCRIHLAFIYWLKENGHLNAIRDNSIRNLEDSLVNSKVTRCLTIDKKKKRLRINYDGK